MPQLDGILAIAILLIILFHVLFFALSLVFSILSYVAIEQWFIGKGMKQKVNKRFPK